MFAMFITVAMGAQHILGFLLFQPWPDRMRSWGGFTACHNTTAQMLFGRGRKGREDTLVSGYHADVEFFIRMGCWNLDGSLALMRFDDECAKETMAGESCLFSFFCLNCFFLFPELHHDGDAKRIGSIDFSSPLRLISQLKDDRTR